jgi:hypothetical protein
MNSLITIITVIMCKAITEIGPACNSHVPDNHRAFVVGFVVDRVTLGQVVLLIL